MRNRLRRLWIPLVLAVASQARLAVSDSPDIPFKVQQQHIIVVRGAIGGLKNLDLAIDTGSMVSVIDPRVAKKLRLETHGETDAVSMNETIRVRQATARDIEFGPFRSTELTVHVIDLSFFGPGSSIDAIVGLDVLSKTSFTIDYRAKRIQIGSRDGDNSLPLQSGFPVPVIEVEVAGERLRLLLDTGGRDLVLFPNRLQSNAAAGVRILSEYTVDHLGGRARLMKAELREILIGASRLEKTTAYLMEVPAHAYPGLHGVLGVTSLGWRRVHFDFERNTVGWEK